MKDYYDILGVTRETDEDEIRRRYRKLAMQYHPDRNPDDPEAEMKFKEIAEAYGVLTDPIKRRQYEAARATGGDWEQEGGFAYSQEDILRDLFQDPRFQQLFQGLLREFQQSGFRANSRFIRQSFFGGKGMFIGGLFLFGSLAGPALRRSAGIENKGGKPLLGQVRGALQSLLGGSAPPAEPGLEPDPEAGPAASPSPLDITYLTPLSADELRYGKTIQVVTEGPDGQEMLKVRIPENSRPGRKLRLRGKGKTGDGERGDLFLQLDERS